MDSTRFTCLLSLLYVTITRVWSPQAATPVTSPGLIRGVSIIRRTTLDEFDLNISSAAKRCDEHPSRVMANTLRANCSSWRKSTAAGSCHLRCRCLGNATSFLAYEKRCVDERRLREGRCTYIYIYR